LPGLTLSCDVILLYPLPKELGLQKWTIVTQPSTYCFWHIFFLFPS
jgi:hypothetical protein